MNIEERIQKMLKLLPPSTNRSRFETYFKSVNSHVSPVIGERRQKALFLIEDGLQELCIEEAANAIMAGLVADLQAHVAYAKGDSTPTMTKGPSGFCDFCSDPTVTHVYPAADNTVVYEVKDVVKGVSDGCWMACQTCHDLIEANDRPGLTLRAVKGVTDRFPYVSSERAARIILEIHDKFFASRTTTKPVNFG